MSLSDKNIELRRYSQRALDEVDHPFVRPILGSRSVPVYLSDPYILYEKLALSILDSSLVCLELGCGTGRHSVVLLENNSSVILSDISLEALKVAEKKFSPFYGNFSVAIADIESLPFPNSTFDVICCSGSLSYGDPLLVFSEIRRCLRIGGTVLFLDSLNSNPIYHFNRWLHYLRGHRTKSTIERIPSIELLENFSSDFLHSRIDYFGSSVFLMGIINFIVGPIFALNIYKFLDKLIKPRKSAFNFVLFATDFHKVKNVPQ